MRKLKELLPVILIGINQYMITDKNARGLCAVVLYLQEDKLINDQECIYLIKWIDKTMSKDYLDRTGYTGIWGWVSCDAKIRKDWINEQIKKL